MTPGAPRTDDPGAEAAAGRRGRRGSWIAAAIFVALTIVAFISLRGWYERERYLELREHRTRSSRFALEELIDHARPRPECGVALVTIDDLTAADLEALADLASPVARRIPDRPLDMVQGRTRELLGLTAPPDADPGYTLGRLMSAGIRVRIGPVPGAGEIGGRGTPAELASLVADSLGSKGFATIAVLGAPVPADQPSAATGTPPGSVRGRATPSGFERIIEDRPAITGFLDEGEASWVSASGAAAIEAERDRRFLVWLDYTELRPPALPHRRFRSPDPRSSELAAIDHYLGRFLAYLDACDCERGIALVLAADPDRDGFLHGYVVGGVVPATMTPGQLASTLIAIRSRAPAGSAGSGPRSPSS